MKNIVFSLILGGLVLFPRGFSKAQEFSWNYEKTSVLEYLTVWRNQTDADAYLRASEKALRLEFLHRLIFYVDRKYTTQSFREFITFAIWDMKATDEMAQNQSFKSQKIFLENLTWALRDVLEPSENILFFIRSYTEFSGLEQPESQDDFLQSRAYTNGIETEPADGATNLEEAGNWAAINEPLFSDSETLENQTPTVPGQIQNPSLLQTEDEHPTSRIH